MTAPWHLTAARIDAAWDDLAAENAALREENERLMAANKARVEYLTTRRAGNDVDSYVNLAETEIEALRSRLARELDGIKALEAVIVSRGERLAEVERERDTAFETWKKFHQETLAAFIKNEHEPLKLRLAEAERSIDTLLGMIRHQRDVLRECLPYLNESMAGRRPGRSADDIRASVKALTADSATHRENDTHD